MPRPAVSLSHELHLLLGGIDGSRILAKRVPEASFENPKEQRELAGAVVSMLVVLAERLRLLDRVARDIVDPGLLLCPQNEALPPDTDERGIVLPCWSDKKLARKHRKAWKSAQRRYQLTRER